MAELVSSAVAHETVSQILSGLVKKYEEKEESSANRNLERLEMAHIRLEAALEASNKWQITDVSLLRWRRKLKRAAQECDDTLCKCKQRILEDEQMKQEESNSSLPQRIVHATKSLVFSVLNCENSELSRSTVQRFEWYADGASEFLRFIEIGGTPHCHMPFHSIVKNLFAGKELHHKIIGKNGYLMFQLWLVPYSTAAHGTEASLIFIQYDGTQEGNIFFSMIIQLSESTDIIGIAVKCLQLFSPHFKCAVENIRNELIQLPTQDFSWVPPVYSYQKEHWDSLHSFGSQWFRPNPLCCKHQDRPPLQRISNLDTKGLSEVLLEPVVEFNLQYQVSLSRNTTSLQDYPYLKSGISFAPHGSSGDMLPANRSYEIVSEEQHTLEQLEGIMLPKATDYFCQNTEAAVYKMIWKSKHGFALIQVEKPCMSTWSRRMRTQRTLGGPKKRKLFQGQDQELRDRTHMISHLLDLWVAHVPVRLQRSLMDWMKKEKESQLAHKAHLEF
ncbi:unnamed protein product [Urochloa decumbens]|uniref:Rx N-terminal domain-containing protein n=1 Tax=Urochloa decumbens TaxID=240449 RepID=A0ABC9GBM4_9POAL